MADTMHERFANSWTHDNRSTMALAVWSSMIVLIGTLPLSNFVGHSHWEYIQWSVYSRQWRSMRFYFDVIANIALFYPFGLLLARRFSEHHGNNALALVGAGLLVSVCIELFQVFCHNRFPSLIDVVSNTGGTALGVATAHKVLSHWLFDAWFPSLTPIPPDRNHVL